MTRNKIDATLEENIAKEILRNAKKLRLAAECAKLDADDEKSLAEEFIDPKAWPEY